MKKGSNRFSIADAPVYPHIKLTNDRFPRLLATRLFNDDRSEYFGAFLNRSNARILLDFLNRTFRLRSCEIDVDGTWNYPCTMHYKGRCLAPCVADLCDSGKYQEMLTVVELFLRNERGLLRTVIVEKIQRLSDRLEFELASSWKDILENIEEYWSNDRYAPWLDRVADTYDFRCTEDGLDVFLTSQKGRRVLGERVFSFPQASEADAPAAMSAIIQQFYRSHAPKEVRVDAHLPDKNSLQKKLTAIVGRKVSILRSTEKNRRVSTERSVTRSSAELNIKRVKPVLSPSEMMKQIAEVLELPEVPTRITSIDVAHISGTDLVAAGISWENGRIINSEFRVIEGSGEVAAMSQFILHAFPAISAGHMLLIDGGVAHFNSIVADSPYATPLAVAAVKPKGKHSEISHFLTDKERFDFNPNLDSHNLLKRLRDQAHDFANSVHRDVRDFTGFYELTSVLPSISETERRRLLNALGSIRRILSADTEKLNAVLGPRSSIAIADIKTYKTGRAPSVTPLIVPTSMQDEFGAAEDLRPLAKR